MIRNALQDRFAHRVDHSPQTARKRWRGAALTEFIISYGAYALTLVVVVGAAAGLYLSLSSNQIQSDLRSIVNHVAERYPGSKYADLTGEALAEMRTFPVSQRQGACTTGSTNTDNCAPQAGGLRVSLGPGGAGYADTTANKTDLGASGSSRFILRVSSGTFAALAATSLDTDQCVAVASFEHPRLVGVSINSPAASAADLGGFKVPAAPADDAGAASPHTWKGNVERSSSAIEAACADTTNANQRTVYLAFR